MAQRLKRWESPRKEGRNAKGKGGSARQRQVRKQMQGLRQKLKSDDSQKEQSKPTHQGEEIITLFPYFFASNLASK
ncbi:MAG: hypothetical protein ACFE0J_24565 [Elainellaceae cyanobacterium]